MKQGSTRLRCSSCAMRGAALRKELKQLSGDAEGRKSAEFRLQYKKKFAEYKRDQRKALESVSSLGSSEESGGVNIWCEQEL